MRIIEIVDKFDGDLISSISYLADDYFLDADVIFFSIAAIQREFSNLPAVHCYPISASLPRPFQSAILVKSKNADIRFCPSRLHIMKF